MLRGEFIRSTCALTFGGLVTMTCLSFASGQSRTLRKYQIDSEKCNGCRNCLFACRQKAIIMQKDNKAVISEEKCKGCGDCLRRCRPRAIVPMEGEQEKGGNDRKVREVETSFII